MFLFNFSSLQSFLSKNIFKDRRSIAFLLIIIGLLMIIVSAIILFPYSTLESVILIIFILFYGFIELINGIAGLLIEFKSDYRIIATASRYIIIILIFIPYICVIASFIVFNPLLNAFRINSLILSLISLIDLASIPILKFYYEKEY
ncbi:MAG: hypothetical protein ACTSQY_05995 [Candidatus Odinarchaeia archaeon]